MNLRSERRLQQLIRNFPLATGELIEAFIFSPLDSFSKLIDPTARQYYL